MFYSLISDEKYNIRNLPILQIPEDIRAKDPAFIYSPHYEMQKDNFVIKLGPNVINFSITDEYPGWDIFIEKICIIIKKIEEYNFIKKYIRLGVRYISFFDSNIFDNSQISIKLFEKKLDTEKIALQTEKYDQGTLTKITVANNSRLNVRGKLKKGSIIDIDCLKKIHDDSFNINFLEIINSVHDIEKRTFFNLLTEEYISSLEPEY